LLVEGLKPVLAHAEKEGVLLLVEPEPDLLIEKADQFLEFIGHVDSPAVGLNFDIGHFYCVGDDPAATVPRLARYARHYHLEDIAATPVHHHLIPADVRPAPLPPPPLIPGGAPLDLPAPPGPTRDSGYDGWITVELYPYVEDPDPAARTAFERVRAVLDGVTKQASGGPRR